jgi:hypothetical protein
MIAEFREGALALLKLRNRTTQMGSHCPTSGAGRSLSIAHLQPPTATTIHLSGEQFRFVLSAKTRSSARWDARDLPPEPLKNLSLQSHHLYLPSICSLCDP